MTCSAVCSQHAACGGRRRYEHLSWEYPSWASISGPAVNLLKGAVLCSDRVVTVSEARLATFFPCTSGGHVLLCRLLNL